MKLINNATSSEHVSSDRGEWNSRLARRVEYGFGVFMLHVLRHSVS